MALPAGSVPPASGTYSLPAARPGRAGRLVLLAAAVVLVLGVGTALLVLLRPSLVGLVGPEEGGEVAAAGSTLPGAVSPGAGGAIRPDGSPASEVGGVADTESPPPRSLGRFLERLRDRREVAEGEGGRPPAADDGGGAAGTQPASAAAAGRQRADVVLPDSSASPAGASPTVASPIAARPTAAGSFAVDPRAASQPGFGQRPPGLPQPSAVDPGSSSPDPSAGRPSRPGATVPGAADDERVPSRPPSAADPSAADPSAADRDAAADDADPADAAPPRPSGPAIATGMRLAMRVMPPDAFVLVDGTVVGKAVQFGARSPLLLPSPGEHRITLRRAGMADRHLRIVASESAAGVSPILATLQPLAAGETPFHELEVHRVGKALAFRVDPPTTRVLVDGVDRGLAARYRGGRLGGGNWLELPLGMHRVSLVAPGRRRLDVAVDVTSGADEERRVVRLSLPPLPEGAP